MPMSTGLYFSDGFVLAAGSVLFRLRPDTAGAHSSPPDGLQICILRLGSSKSHSVLSTSTSLAPNPPALPPATEYIQYVLPKGRKDQIESLPIAALRETYEETGYQCVHLPCLLPTRAPLPNINTLDIVRIVDGVREEPFAVSVREVRKRVYFDKSGDAAAEGEGVRKETAGGVKFIFWYLLRVQDNASAPIKGTQTESENYEPCFINADEAVELLSRAEDKDIARKAIDLVKNSDTALSALRNGSDQ